MANKTETTSPAKSLLSSALALVIVLAVLVGAYLYGKSRADRGLLIAFESQAAKERLVAEMRYQVQVATEAEKNAVMADTDDASEKFAQESRRASAAVEESRRALGSLIEADERKDEVDRFAKFSEAWTKHQELDEEILSLAVENTNLKAMRLSFGSASEAIQRMETATKAVAGQSVSSEDGDAIRKGAYDALIAALKIHSLHGRHIAEPRDDQMDRIEADMKTLNARAKEDLDTIAAAADESLAPTIAEAKNAYSKFQEVNAQIIELSRRNSNVRSVAISLGAKQQLTAECRALLSSLHDSIRGEKPVPTR